MILVYLYTNTKTIKQKQLIKLSYGKIRRNFTIIRRKKSESS